MKKKIWLFLFAALVLGGCKSEEEPQAVSVLSDSMLTAAVVDGQDAYAAVEGEEIQGIEADALRFAGADAQITVTFVPVKTQEEALAMVDAGTADLAAGRFEKNRVDGDLYVSTSTYRKGGLYLVTGKGNYTNTLTGFTGKTIALSPSVPDELWAQIQGSEDTQRLDAASAAEGAQAVKDQKAGALVCTEREAFAVMDEELQVQELLNSPLERYVFLLSGGQEEACGILNSGISGYLDQQSLGVSQQASDAGEETTAE